MLKVSQTVSKFLRINGVGTPLLLSQCLWQALKRRNSSVFMHTVSVSAHTYNDTSFINYGHTKYQLSRVIVIEGIQIWPLPPLSPSSCSFSSTLLFLLSNSFLSVPSLSFLLSYSIYSFFPLFLPSFIFLSLFLCLLSFPLPFSLPSLSPTHFYPPSSSHLTCFLHPSRCSS